jgi:[protein-PII] uridylyltransferase
MTEKKSIKSESFWSDFSRIYKNPSLIDKYLIDNSNSIEEIIIDSFKELNLDKNYSIYANGGFGKKEMFLSSDVDISIVKNNSLHDSNADLEVFIAKLWDLGFQVGHSVRSIKDIKKITKKDLKEFTSYLTRRPLISKSDTERQITKSLNNAWSKKSFFNAKLIEQEERYSSYHSTEFNLEPDLKESPGCMRDFQTSLWILQQCFNLSNYNEIKNSIKFSSDIESAVTSYNFIKTLRFATNILSSKNRLSFESQIEISKAAKLGKYNDKDLVEKMMKDFYGHASNLSNFNRFVFDTFKEKNSFAITQKFGKFYLKGKKIGIKNYDLSKNRDLIFGIFIAIGRNKNIKAVDTSTMNMLKENIHLIDDDFKNNNSYASQFLEILKSKYNLSSILKSMKNLGIIQAYIKEFDEVVGQMQFDLFHVYTVDEHTFKVMRNMRQMQIELQEDFKLEHELLNKIPKIEILYLAGLFHDLGKGKGGDHSKIGAQTSYAFAKKIGLSLADADLISWLVLNHLQMSSISQKKDISDPKTIEVFADMVLNTERLDYLYLLTINDVKATNPSLWNGWKHGLLRDLFLLTRSKLNKEPVKSSKEISLDRQKNVLKSLDSNKKIEIESYFNNFDVAYFNKNNSERLLWQSRLILDGNKNDLIVGSRKCFGNLLEVFIKTQNFDGLFLKLIEVLELSGLEIIDASIATSKNKDIAANTFISKFVHHDRVLNNSEVNEIKLRIISNFENFSTKKILPKENHKKRNAFKNSMHITNTEDKAKRKNLLTIETSDAPGLLAKIAKVLHDNGTSIYSARINTLGDRVEDTFEIEDVTLSSVSDKKIKKITSDLKQVI